MTLRALLVASLVLTCGQAAAAPSGVRAAPGEPLAAPMVFYVAKGAPDACGIGCDSWIVAEGQIDSGAAPRFRKFLRQLRDRNLPIYFSSPGGNLDQALAMGNMLRERPMVARVARTVVNECGFEAQDSAVCLKLKQSGRELHGGLWTRNAMCNSACPYLILGATTREIAPDAVLAVHSPKVVVSFRGGIPTQQMRAAATARGIERADTMLSSYVHKMGGEGALLDLAKTIKFESMHVLTREEIFRFGIDRRDFIESPWTFESSSRSMVRKIAIAKKNGGASFRSMEWRLFCENKGRARLMFVREFDADAVGKTSVIMMAGAEKSVNFGRYPARMGKYEVWSDTVAPDPMKAILAASHLQIGEGTMTPDGKNNLASFNILTNGLEAAWTQLLASCPAVSNSAVPASVSPGLAATPVH